MLLYSQLENDVLKPILTAYSMRIVEVTDNQTIPYSFWGDREAGRLGNTLYARADTPLHSLLHELCHYICMPASERNKDLVDAAGSASEENACCFFQIILSAFIDNYNQSRLFEDMDSWGYSFRLGSAIRWYTEDAEDTREWLIEKNILLANNQPSWELRN
jgi:hypothetical protein|tara:strand:+ start:22080 stop:22562 length:483 start_codon:yes stop_codon:yes gene_type:complete